MGCLAVPADVGKEADQAWTGFAAWPSFLPFVQNLARWSLTQGQARSVTIGQPLQGRGGESVELIKPDGSTQRLATTPDPSGNLWHLSRTDQLGVYRYHDSRQDHSLAVNVDLAESDLSTIEWEPLRESYQSESVRRSPAQPTTNDWTQQPLFRYALGATLGFLLLEMSVIGWLQRRFG